MKHLFAIALLILVAASPVAMAETVMVKYRGPVDTLHFRCDDVSRSSLVNRVCYDASNQYMLIALKGTYYHYCGIYSSTVSELMAASSMGRFFNGNIKGSFDWENGQWKPSGFNTGQPFVLVQDGDVLTQKSAMTAMWGVVVGIDTREKIDTFYKLVSCQRKDGTFGHQIFCRDPNGGSLVFSPTTGQGGVSRIFGLMDPKRRDTPLVSPFACQKY